MSRAKRSFDQSDLVEIGRRFGFSDLVEILHVDQLIIVKETGVGRLKFFLLENVFQIAQILVTPVVQRAERRTGSTLCVQIDRRHAQTN